MTVLALAVLLLTAAAPLLVLLLRRRWVDPTVAVAAVIVGLLALAAAVAAFADDVTGWRAGAAAVLGVTAATTAGSDVVRASFRAMRGEFDVRRRPGGRQPAASAASEPLDDAPLEALDAPPAPRRSGDNVLRGGVWIGYLERAAVSATLLAGWPEGIALVLAVKGVGRYPELRGSPAGETDASEAFIIGTLVSVLWAAAAAGTARLVG